MDRRRSELPARGVSEVLRSAAEGWRWVSGAGVVKSETPFGSGSNALSIVALTLSLSHSVATLSCIEPLIL